ncbi:MAG: hypothetical protein COU31_03180 [Candidatus Magasanikbacteria bacterium CG10_big_fil_rev_8_21_14_0_10_40_10]|uniref:Uncharacterized protein n=1 Tax=Candidatus Magasanikbacteria bacterium CG10_big_fil_rev_8_21_14_0_10_40_10 TaxID=1974648 RepID=A0A2M6W3L8_9BACT|nr:MAG: hypothetical protein COU31_03180 [Candidatus Magasanikbacteria bacterium CG10_big_fil_rev_8_21_14_0_10_40_10]
MSTISVPLKPQQEQFIAAMIKSGRAANKAHAVRYAIDMLREAEVVPKDELAQFMAASGRDILKVIGPISKKDYDYYENL